MNKQQAQHPNRETLEAFVHGLLDAREQEQVEQHVADCEICCQLLRDVPHDHLVEQVRLVDTSSLGETIAAQLQTGTPEGGSDFELEAKSVKLNQQNIPRELFEHPRYRIVRQLGVGGMGVVYQAEHRMMERLVALKVVNSHLLSSKEALERFHREVKAAAKLTHRNIVTAFDAEQAGDLHFLVMEYVEGVNLFELVAERGQLPVLYACNYIMQVAQGLKHAFNCKMVHRDIKPQNLMRTPRGTIKVLDFGLARFASQQPESIDSALTGIGATVGTPDYIAPEQARDSRDADIRSDIYSLGCTFYFLLAGRVPFTEKTPLEKIMGHLQKEPKNLSEYRSDIPDEVVQIISRMMAKEPAKRYQTPGEVVEALKPFGKPGMKSQTQATIDTTLANATPTEKPLAEFLSHLQTDEPPVSAAGTGSDKDGSAQTKSKLRFNGLQNKYRLLAGGGIAGLLLVIFIAYPYLFNSATGITEKQNNIEQALVRENNVTPQVVTPRQTEQQPGEWVNLITDINPEQHGVAGRWTRTKGELHVDASENARLELPFQPPAQYDLEITFTRQSGEQSVAIIFVAGNNQAVFDLDAWNSNLAGIQNIDNRSLNNQRASTRVENIKLINGTKYTATLKIRTDHIETYLNNKLLMTYYGDGSNLSLPQQFWSLPGTNSLGIGAYNSATTFHQIRIRLPVSGN